MGQSKTLVLTGGHAGATAYALVQALKKNKTFNWKIHFIGASSAFEGKNVSTFGKKVLPPIGVAYHSITSGRLQRRFSAHTIPSLLKIPVGFVEAFGLIRKINPDIILSFGGYTSFPVVVVGKLLGKRVILHEQTSAYGRANRFSQVFADKIALSRGESKKHFDSDKVLVTGNPVSEEICSVKPKKNLGSPPTIFVTGGSRGAQIINETLAIIAPKLLSRFKIIHQVGEADYDKYVLLKDSLEDLGKNYDVFGVIPPAKWYQYIEISDFIISRAGANMISELLVVKRPSILIPIPWSFGDEQNKNALFAKEFGIARILPQDKLSPQTLMMEIDKLLDNWKDMVDAAGSKQSPDVKASENLVNLLISEISK